MRRLIVALVSLLVSIPTFAAISGSIIDMDGQAVSGAKVSVFAPETYEARRARLQSNTPERTPLLSTTSNAKGVFSFDPPKLPLFEVQIDAGGFIPDQVQATPADDIGTIALAKADLKQGKVTANGTPVANAFVCWIGGNGVEVAAHTDAKGQYSVPDPSKWAERRLVLHPDYALDAKVILPVDRNIGADVTLTPGITLAGGVVAEDGQTPVAKADISVYGFTVATTGDDGRFKIAHAPQQWQTLTATAGDRIGSVTQVSKGLTIRLAKGAFITGSVRDTKAQVPLVDAGVVANLNTGGRNLLVIQGAPSSALTDAKGNFSIGPLPPGSYNLMMQRAGYAAAMSTISLTPGQKLSRALVAIPVARVSGMVVDENKMPVGGALITTRELSRGRGGVFAMMMPMQGERTTWSGADGRFSAVASEGDAQFEAVKRGWPAATSSTVHLAAGDRKSGVVITVPRGIEVTGKVIDQKGKPVSGVSVMAEETETGGGMGRMVRRVIARAAMRDNNDTVVRTAADGTFLIRVKEGLYDFAFQRSGFSQQTMRAQQVNAGTKPLTVTLDPSVEITGRVVRGSTPLAGATIYAALIGGGGAGMTTSAITAADGSFRLEDLSPGSMMLVVSKPDEMVQTMKPATAPSRDIVVDLPSVSRVSGRVIDKSSNKPITSFEVGVTGSRAGGGGMMMMMTPMMQSFTSDDGTFTLDNVPVGTPQIIASAPGYTTSRVSTTVEEGKAVTGVDIALEAGAKLTGHVTGPDGAPLAGVVVRPEMTGGRGMMRPPTNAATTTDANGEYSLDSLEPGDHTFSFNYSSLPPLSKSVTLSDKETRLDVQFTNGIRVTGQVVTDAGAPVADAQVRAMSAAEGPMSGNGTRTDGSGSFILEGLAPGHYTFSAAKAGYAEGILQDVDIASGAPVRLTMKSGGVIMGHVTGLSAAEMSQTNVNAFSSSGSASAPLDSSGNYRIDGAPIGTVRVQANVQMGLAGGRTSPPKTVQVDTGATVQADLQFASDTIVTGRITRAGTPLDGTMVAFLPRGGGAQTNSRTTTGGDGSYSVSGLEDGNYAVQVTDIGRGISYSTNYQVKGSGTFDIDMKLTSVRGHVIDSSTGEALANATVEVRPTAGNSGGMFGMRPTAMSDANGYYQVDSVAAGSYQASASKDGYGNSLQDVSVSDSAVDLDFKLTPQAGVTLTVIDGRDRTMLAANVRVFDMSGRDVYDTPVRFGGGAGPINLTLAAGTYRAIVSAQGYASQTITIISPSQPPPVALTPGGTLVVHSRSNTTVRARLVGSDGTPYARFGGAGIFMLNAAPLPTTMQNIASGTYTLQVLDANNNVVSSQTVTIVDGGIADVSA